MTSWRMPDYQIKVAIPEDKYTQFIALSGNTFAIELYRNNRVRPVLGMVIISHVNKTKKAQTQAWCCLWIDSKKSIIPLNEYVQLVLIEECDPMFQLSDEKDEVNKMLPITLNGKIYKIEENPLSVGRALARQKGEQP